MVVRAHGPFVSICWVDGGVTESPEIVAGFFMTRWLVGKVENNVQASKAQIQHLESAS